MVHESDRNRDRCKARRRALFHLLIFLLHPILFPLVLLLLIAANTNTTTNSRTTITNTTPNNNTRTIATAPPIFDAANTRALGRAGGIDGVCGGGGGDVALALGVCEVGVGACVGGGSRGWGGSTRKMCATGGARRGTCGARGCGRARCETAGEFDEQEDQYVRGKDTGDAARAKRQHKDDEGDAIVEGDGDGSKWNWRRRSSREIIE